MKSSAQPRAGSNILFRVSPQDADGDLHEVNFKLLVLAREREVARPTELPQKSPRARGGSTAGLQRARAGGQ